MTNATDGGPHIVLGPGGDYRREIYLGFSNRPGHVDATSTSRPGQLFAWVMRFLEDG